MTTINVYKVLQMRALVTREAARRLLTHLAEREVSGGQESLDLDFSQVEAISPSFVDELLGGLLSLTDRGPHVVRFLEPPGRLPSKLEAVARARAVKIADGSTEWIVDLPVA